MGRSEAAKERRRAYCRAWRAAHPTYHAEYRAAHPELRAVDRERNRAWKQDPANREKLRAQWARRAERLAVARALPYDLPPSHTGHPLFEAATAALEKVGLRRDDQLNSIHDSAWEDVASAVVVALLEGAEPVAAARAALRAERRWRNWHLPLYPVVLETRAG